MTSCTDVQSPIEKHGYQSLTSYDELVEYVNIKSIDSDLITLDTLAITFGKRWIPLLKISSTNFSKIPGKVTVLIFAQQHGDEQSGKEAALLLIEKISEGNLNYLFKKIDLLLVPQVNPDGSEKNKRRNANNEDLNRNHLILTENETIGLHKLFNAYLPEVTLDVHEYYPYSKSWMEYGYIKSFDEQMGTVTNPNISKRIKEYQKQKFIPYIKDYLEKSGYSFHEYIVGGPPNIERIRYSTVDIDDGRHSFGIYNTFSFIFEGRSGRDSLDNLQHRVLGQYNALLGFLEYIYNNAQEIKKIIDGERYKLVNSKEGEEVVIRMEHYGDSRGLDLTLFSLSSNKDTVITVNAFHDKIKSLKIIEKPAGYLIPRDHSKLAGWLIKNNIAISKLGEVSDVGVYRYTLTRINHSIDEELEKLNPEIRLKRFRKLDVSKYYYVPINQLASNLLVLALEPQSMIGLVQYKSFFNNLNPGAKFPILRVNNQYEFQ